jgi:hypothetical protein
MAGSPIAWIWSTNISASKLILVRIILVLTAPATVEMRSLRFIKGVVEVAMLSATLALSLEAMEATSETVLAASSPRDR